jgi:hypothetical protein
MNKVKTHRARRLTAIVTAAAIALAMAISAAPASAFLDITSFDGGTATDIDPATLDLTGSPENEAGTRPRIAATTFMLSQALGGDGFEYSTEDLKDVVVDLPPGLIGNPNAAPTCTEAELTANGSQTSCPLGSQVGIVAIYRNGNVGTPGNPTIGYTPLFNMRAPDGKAAMLGFNFLAAVYHITAELRRDDSVAGNYRVRVSAVNNPQTITLAGATAIVWGVPADPSFNSDRGWESDLGDGTSCFGPLHDSSPGCDFPSLEPRKPFFTLPTSCEGPVQTDLSVTGWEGGSDSSSFLSHDLTAPTPLPLGNEGCDALEFSPTLEVQPTTDVADSPTGLDVDLHIPQNEDPDGNATAHLKDTTVTLPEGMVINPSSANGLGACAPNQINLQTDDPAACPDNSKVGLVQVETPLLDHPVPGAVYVATPFDNPFDSLLAIYIAVNDPISGTVVKLAGEVQLDPQTGRVTTTVAENPQVPFEDFHLRFFDGPAAALRTPSTCGEYSTTSSLTPWSAPASGPQATPSDSYEIERSPAGGGCPRSQGDRPLNPSFEAGTINPLAGAHSPLVMNLKREDGSQEFSAITLDAPQGLLGKLAGVPYCPQSALDAAAAKSGKQEESSASCPSASEVGSVVAGAGAGPTPYYAQGKVYLAGPYKGAPLSLAIVTPATAGPFDLGTIVVRTALQVNPKTAQITAVSDPLPTILEGIPLDVRSVQVKLDRPGFILNPTSCEPTSFSGQLTSTLGQTVGMSNRFQVGNCESLGFKPNLRLRLKGETKRDKYQQLTATLTARPGDANIAGASVRFPQSIFLAQEHIRTICTRVQFAADSCPPGSVYGRAEAVTPLLDKPLTGPVYLRSSDNVLPDLVAALRGPDDQPVEIELVGRTDSKNRGLRNTFDVVPDAPVSKFTLRMLGGKKSLLVTSRNICLRKEKAVVKMRGQNGMTRNFRPVIQAACKKKQKQPRRGKNRR